MLLHLLHSLLVFARLAGSTLQTYARAACAGASGGPGAVGSSSAKPLIAFQSSQSREDDMSEQQDKLNRAMALIGRGRISRRDFVQLALAAGLTATAASTLYAETARAEPKSGGSARFGLAHGSATDTLDPANWPDTFTQTAFWGALSNSLTQVDAKGEIQPDVAESFEQSDGAKKWVFKIRKGITFHDGKTVTADDVIASLQHHRGPDTKSAAKSLLETITDIKADGQDTVVFTLAEGNADFPYVVSDYHMPIMPAKDGKADWQSGVRTGPFTFVSFEPGVSAKFKKNPNYYKSGQPYLDEVTFLALTDVGARTNALLAGEVDYIGRADLKTLDMLKGNPDLDIIEVAGYGHYTLPMNVTMKPFDDPNVRLALKWAINRKEIADKIFFGHATVANDDPLAPSIKYAINPQPVFEFNPEKSKEYLKKAGLDKLSVDLSVSDAAFAGAVDAAQLIRETAKQCGIDVNIVREPSELLLGQCVAEEAMVRLLLVRTRHGGLDVHHHLCRRCGVERHLLEQQALQRTADRGARRNRPRQARRDVCRDAADQPRRQRQHRAGVQQLRECCIEAAGPRRNCAQLGKRRPEDCRALVGEFLTPLPLPAARGGERTFGNVTGAARNCIVLQLVLPG